MERLGRLKETDTANKERIDKKELTEQRATPVANSNRDLWSGGLVAGLTPERLAVLLNRVRRGEVPAEYLEIAGELEERDAHYLRYCRHASTPSKDWSCMCKQAETIKKRLSLRKR